jgi:hypothetical protein
MSKEAIKLCAQLKLPPAPLVIAGLETTLGFFREHLRIDPLRWTDAFGNIDFLHAVRAEMLTPRVRLAARAIARDASTNERCPFAFYTTPSTLPDEAAVQVWEVPEKIRVLASQATTLALGGRQYLLSADDARKLVKVEVPEA